MSKVKQGTQPNDITMRIKSYESFLPQLDKLNFNEYIYFPEISEKTIRYNLVIENKDIAKNMIQINIKRLVDCKADKYQFVYSLSHEQSTFSHTSNWCDNALVFNNIQKYTFPSDVPSGLTSKTIDISII